MFCPLTVFILVPLTSSSCKDTHLVQSQTFKILFVVSYQVLPGSGFTGATSQEEEACSILSSTYFFVAGLPSYVGVYGV